MTFVAVEKGKHIMSDYIKREDALRIVNATDIDTIRLEDVKRITNKCAKGIKAIPAADVVERKVGKWEFIGGYGYQYRCSVCITCAERKEKYCPHCGAKMEGNE